MKIRLNTFILIVCTAIIVLGGSVLWFDARVDADIAAQNERYRAMKNTVVQQASAEPTPMPTPDGDTVRITLPTEPPRDDTYAMLSAVNPDFCGWLQAGKVDLPVVHRENDNDTYLTTNLSGEESIGGTLFVDGYNRLYPADMLTIIYGHNMNSGDMFGSLDKFLQPEYLQQHPIVHFDTVYASGRYVPFAVFSTAAENVDIRQFQPSVEEFNALIDQCRQLSAYNTGVDVRYGDTLLALVTCKGDADDRLFVLCRALRESENEMDIVMLLDSLTEE